MKVPLPSLSSKGWITEIAEKCDMLLSYFFISDHSQTYLYKNNVTSLPYLIQQHGHEKNKLNNEIEKALFVYLKRYFDDVLIETSVQEDEKEKSKLDITIDIIINEDGKRHSLGRLIRSLNSKIVEIIKVNNGE